MRFYIVVLDMVVFDMVVLDMVVLVKCNKINNQNLSKRVYFAILTVSFHYKTFIPNYDFLFNTSVFTHLSFTLFSVCLLLHTHLLIN